MASGGGKGVPALHSPQLVGNARGKGGAFGRKKQKSSSSKSMKAGLNFPVGRIWRYLKDGRYAPRVGVKASVFMAAALEYLCTEVIDLAANEAKDAGKTRITPRHIQLAVRNDQELNTMLEKVTIASGGVIPQQPPPTVHRKTKSSKAKAAATAGKDSMGGGVARDSGLADEGGGI